MSSKIQTYAELQRMIRKALREQHPEWIDANGQCTLCDSYEARFARLLRIFAPHETMNPRSRICGASTSYSGSVQAKSPLISAKAEDICPRQFISTAP